MRCLVPRPARYRTLLRWPASKDAAWFANVLLKRLVEEKKSQIWEVGRRAACFSGRLDFLPKGDADYIKEKAKSDVDKLFFGFSKIRDNLAVIDELLWILQEVCYDWSKGAENHNPAMAKAYIFLHTPQESEVKGKPRPSTSGRK